MIKWLLNLLKKKPVKLTTSISKNWLKEQYQKENSKNEYIGVNWNWPVNK